MSLLSAISAILVMPCDMLCAAIWPPFATIWFWVTAFSGTSVFVVGSSTYWVGCEFCKLPSAATN